MRQCRAAPVNTAWSAALIRKPVRKHFHTWEKRHIVISWDTNVEMKHQNQSRVLPLLSIDNHYTSCLERKQQTCGVFGLELSVSITNITLKNKHKRI